METLGKIENDHLKQISIASSVMRGSVWMMAARLISRGVGIIATTILARLLSPNEFGLIAIGVLSVSLMQVFTEVGIQQALIKESDANTEKYLDTAWTVEVIRGVSICLLVYCAAPSIAIFFHESDAVSIIRTLAVIPLMNGLKSIKIIYLQKELIFRRQFIYEISGTLIPILVSIPLAILLKNVWAIVIGTIMVEVVKLIVSYCLAPYYPRVCFNVKDFLGLFGFGRWIFLGSIISYFAMELDTLFAARLLGTSTLGTYVLAFGLTNKPVIEVAKSLGKVFFPAFAKISHDPIRVKNAFIKSTSVLYSLIIPASIGIIFIAEDFVKIFLGEDWVEMIPVIHILAIGALARGVGIPTGSLFNGLGKPDLVFYANTVRLIVLIALLNLTAYLLPTPLGISLAVLVANSGFFFLFVFQTIKFTQINVIDWIVLIFPILLSVTVMIFSINLVTSNVGPSLFRFIVIIFLSVFSYTIALILCWICLRLGPFGYFHSVCKDCLFTFPRN